MSISVLNLLNRDTRRVAKLVDETFWRLMEPTSDVDRQMPIMSYPDPDLLLVKMNHGKPTIASIVGIEQEIPVQRSRMVLTEEYTQQLKLGKQIVWKENDYKLLRKLENYSREAQNAELISAIERHFFGAVADLVPAVLEKATMLMMKVATTGTCIFTDPLTSAQVSLDYSDKTLGTLLLAQLTGGARWSQAATADALGDLEAHARSYYDEFGMFPDEITMPWATMREVADQSSTKTAAMVARGNSNVTSSDVDALYLSDEETLALMRQRTRCQNITFVDSMYTEEAADGSTTDKYFLERDFYYFNSPGMFERAFVPTVENSFQQGIYTRTKEVNDAPKIERTVAVGAFVPMCSDPRKIAARQVN